MEENESSYLVIKNITKIFNEGRQNSVTAVENFSLTVRKGDFITLLGPSGCGKTTTLRMIAGFEPQTSGEISLEGKSIDSLESFSRNMPMVFQNFALFPHLTVYENIAYGLKLRNLTKDTIENDVAMISYMVNLVGLEERYPRELSGGQQQRVALARALVLKPSIILFDEPLSNLDSKLRTQTRIEIKRVQQLLGITALYVTHDQSEALSMSDRIVIMNKGKIAQIGTPSEIYKKPNCPFVADFIGDANFIDVIICEVGEKTLSVVIQGTTIDVAKPDLDFIEGEEIFLAIKPEAISISTKPTAFKGRIDVISFLGRIIEYKIGFENSFISVINFNTTGIIQNHYSFNEEVYVNFKKEDFQVYKK